MSGWYSEQFLQAEMQICLSYFLRSFWQEDTTKKIGIHVGQNITVLKIMQKMTLSLSEESYISSYEKASRQMFTKSCEILQRQLMPYKDEMCLELQTQGTSVVASATNSRTSEAETSKVLLLQVL